MNRIDEIRNRIAKRKREKVSFYYEEEKHGNPLVYSHDGAVEGRHPLFRKEIFLLKIFASACLVLFVAVMFQTHSTISEKVQKFVGQTLSQEFQFAKVNELYEKIFQSKFALLPEKKNEQSLTDQYVVPASGHVLQTFAANGEGVTVETGVNQSVEAIGEGIVLSAGTTEKYGKTVVVQHSDGSESWYGQLNSIAVHDYDFINKGQVLGKVQNKTDSDKAMYYFAIKKGDKFIDPAQVISFE